ncbi:MAG: hypothetical protein JWO38_4034 [Gemmataceae bacterium]|nr:hypothetical protein [Gemmataceae bacterium]
MATYVVTADTNTDWDEEYQYKYRFTSRNGSPVAQDEINRRREAGEPVVLWRWERGQATLVERHTAAPAAAPDPAHGSASESS